MDENPRPTIKGGSRKATDPQMLCIGAPFAAASLKPGGILGFRVSLSINVPRLPRMVPPR